MNSACNDGMQEIQKLNEKLLSANFNYEKTVAQAIKECPSNLDAYDYVFSITIGILSAILDTNDKLADFLDEIHQLASKEKIKTDNALKELLAKVLHHQGDWMDKPLTTTTNKAGKHLKEYITRAAKREGDVWNSNNVSISGPHRIFWGHDIFSIHGDNPFSLCIQEYGVGKGILQAVRHLVADTCSHQGLPLPFSSYFDYIEVTQNADGEVTQKMCNHLLDFCQQYSQEVLGHRQTGIDNEIFNHLFSVHMQDGLSTGLVAAGIAAYCKGRKMEDETRKVQMRVIGYMGAAYGSALLGAATHGGVPYINWPAFAALAKNVIQMIHVTNQEIKKIFFETERLVTERKRIEMKANAVRTDLISGWYGMLTGDRVNEGRNDLIDFLGGE